jgi:branched-chain amino acid transport system permease protein
MIGIYALATLGLNITMGYAGQVNLGQAAFVGIGAFTSAILTTTYGVSFWLALPISGIMALMIGILIGMVSIRLKHDFLAITTIGFNFIVVAIFLYYDFFGGSFGIINIPRPTFFGIPLKGANFMVLVFIILALAMIFNRWMEKSWLGLALQAIKEDEDAAESMGVDVKKYKIIAFSLGAFFAGIAGSLLAHFKTYIVWSDFGFSVSIMLLTMCILGGLESIYGPIVGASIVIFLPEIFRPLADYRLITYAIFLILLLKYMPQGIIGKGSYLDRKIKEFFKGKEKTEGVTRNA